MTDQRPPRSWQPLRSRWRGVTAFGVVDRMAMLAAARRLRRWEVGPSRAVSRALRRTALGRFSDEEKAAMLRVDRHGRNVFSMHSSVAPLWGRFLFALVRELEPSTPVELGTNWGVSGAYQAAALELNGEARLTTFELNPEWAGHAGELFAQLALTERMDQRIGALEETLEPELGRLGTVDYAYVDADHAEEPNRRYLETMLPHLSPGAVLVYDDVSLDSEMRQTWAMVRSHDRIGVTAAAHRMGVAIVAG